MQDFMQLLQGTDVYILIPALAVVVFLVVKLLDHLGYLKTGTAKRIGVIVGAFLASGMLDDLEQQVGGIMIGVLSVIFNEVTVWTSGKIKK